MKKAINILLIAILSVIFIGLVLFVINFAKDIGKENNTKISNKSHHEKSKDKNHKDSNNKTQSNNNENQTVESNNFQSQPNNQNITTNKNGSSNINNNVNTNEVRTNELGEIIHKTKNGIDYTGEFDSPEEEANFEKEVMSQTGGGPTLDKDKSDYEKQQEIYEKAARGEIEEPGARVNSNN